MSDLFTTHSAVLAKAYEESKHPRDSKGRWTAGFSDALTSGAAREIGQTAVSAGVTALISAAPGLFNVLRARRGFKPVGQRTRRDAFIQPYRDAINRLRSVGR